MQDKELLNMWETYDQKLDQVLMLNKEIVYEMTRSKLNKTIGRMQAPKQVMLFIGMPYTLLLYFITFIAYQAEAVFVMLGFGAIGLIMNIVVVSYCYHLFLIHQISRSEEVVEVQKRLAELKFSSFRTTRWAIIQLPFWTICWMSLNALETSPILYGGIHLVLFLGFSYLAYWLYGQLSLENKDSKVSRFFLSGREWTPIIQSSEILDQLKEYE